MSQNRSEALLSLVGITKWLGDAKIVSALDLEIFPHEFVTLLGPSGCGKTTTLRCITGSLGIDDGSIFLRGSDVTHVPTHLRNIGKVFQSFALFPHMTVADNVAFPLRLRKCPGDEIKKRVDEALDLVQLGRLAGRYPRELSGGQQQRVGLARAIVYRPDLVLFDEPLSNLDAKLRRDMRHEIQQLQKQLGFAAIYVTHDQEEALALSDRIAVMNRGVIEQVDGPERIYASPRTLFVASFLGNPNRLDAVVEHVAADRATVKIGSSVLSASLFETAGQGRRATLVIRPESIHVGTGASAREVNRLRCKVAQVGFLGDRWECQVETSDGIRIGFYLPPDRKVEAGHIVDISIPVEECRAYPS